VTVDLEALVRPLEKKPRIDDCLLFEALELCFLSDGGGRAGVASPALTFAMVKGRKVGCVDVAGTNNTSTGKCEAV
jgi:hypothetical protein